MRGMVTAGLLALTSCAAITFAVEFPPIDNRYDTVCEDARSVVKSLKKLQARIEIGIDYSDYDKAVADTFPDVKVFLESAEAQQQPELRFLLDNAMGCHLQVRSLWSQKATSSDPFEKFYAATTLITAQPTLWKVAGENIRVAAANGTKLRL